MKTTTTRGWIAAVLMIAGVQAAYAEDSFRVGTGFDYSSGKYGGTESTDILYIPVTGSYETGPLLFKLTVPYIEITGPGDVVRDLGKVQKGGSTARRTESGLGDIVAGATCGRAKAASRCSILPAR